MKSSEVSIQNNIAGARFRGCGWVPAVGYFDNLLVETFF